MFQQPSDSLRDWMDYYLKMAVDGVRSEEVKQKIQLHLHRFQVFFEERYGQEAIGSCVKRDVVAWQKHLQAQDLAASTINNHLASLSGFAKYNHRNHDGCAPMMDKTCCGMRLYRSKKS